jgi:NADP-dependent 3-hydroxy acid dehydrogenase YdfG
MTTKTIETRTEEEMKRLIIISGGSRGIGRAFADYYSSQPNTDIRRISRKDNSGLTQLNLLNESQVNGFVTSLNLGQVRDIVYMHAVGIDKFEPEGKPQIDYDHDGIDDEVYATNVTAFLNLAEPLIDKVKLTKTPTTICNIGSVSDIYMVPFWQSFSRAKNIVRTYLKSINLDNVKSIMLNVSTTLDEDKTKYGRIYADTTYWQTTEELLSNSINSLEGMKDLNCHYAEFDFYKRNPNFRQDYFTNLPKLFASWQRDMGYAGKQVPLGIRI